MLLKGKNYAFSLQNRPFLPAEKLLRLLFLWLSVSCLFTDKCRIWMRGRPRCWILDSRSLGVCQKDTFLFFLLSLCIALMSCYWRYCDNFQAFAKKNWTFIELVDLCHLRGYSPPNPSVFSGIRIYLPAQWVQWWCSVYISILNF